MNEQLQRPSGYRVAPSVYARPLGEELVLLDFDRGHYFGLNAVGATIWRLLAEGGSATTPAEEMLQKIATTLVSEYEVELQVALDDTRALMGKLLAEGLVQATLD